MNIIDLLIIVFLAYFLVVGYYRGFIRQFLDLISIIVSFMLAFRLYYFVGQLITTLIKIPQDFANVAGFFVIWFVVEFFYYLLMIFFYDRIAENMIQSKWNKYTGSIPSLFRGIIALWVILGLVLILPVSQYYRNLITHSALGSQFVKSSGAVEKYVGKIFGGAIEDTVSFLTIKPESDESIDLGFKTEDVTIDIAAEKRMLELVNKERTDRGLKPLILDTGLQEVARAHSKDMFARGYFAHNTPDGLTPFDRMDKAGIKYITAGENLALAPDVETAHRGLMDSAGHKANILSADFGKVGIGVIKSSKYGEMFSQEFTN